MSLDPQGQYYAALPDEDRGSGTGSLSQIGSGVGAPDGTTKVTTIYVDTATGNVYTYSNGAWVAQGSGSGGTIQVYSYTASPPANPADITKAAIAYDPRGFLPVVGWDTIAHVWST